MFSWKLKNEKVSNIDWFPEYRNQIDASTYLERWFSGLDVYFGFSCFLYECNNLKPTTLTITKKDGDNNLLSFSRESTVETVCLHEITAAYLNLRHLSIQGKPVLRRFT